MERIIKDEKYIKDKYDVNSYRIKSEISKGELAFAIHEGNSDRLILWNDNSPLTIHSANLLGNDEKEFPPILSKQKELYYLAIPSQLAKRINDSEFVSNLRGLRIDGGKFNVRKVLQELSYLSIDGYISFEKHNLPNLRCLSCKYDDKVLNELCKYDEFDKLYLCAVHENILGVVSNIKKLWGLGIHRGKTTDISGISSIQSLHWLSLNSLPNLTDLSELAQLPNLEYLQIGYCKNIKSWDFLLELKELKMLWIPVSSYNECPPQMIIDILIKNGVKV